MLLHHVTRCRFYTIRKHPSTVPPVVYARLRRVFIKVSILWECISAYVFAFQQNQRPIIYLLFRCVCACANACLKKTQNKQKTITHPPSHPSPMIFLSLQWYLGSNWSQERIISLPLTPFTSVPCMIFLPSTPEVEFCLLNFLKTWSLLTFLLAWWHEEAWSDLFHSCSYWFFLPL